MLSIVAHLTCESEHRWVLRLLFINCAIFLDFSLYLAWLWYVHFHHRYHFVADRLTSWMKLAKYRNVLIYTPSFFVMVRLYVCALMAMCISSFIILMPYSGTLTSYPSLNSRDNLRETLDGWEGAVVAMLTWLKTPADASSLCDTQDTTDPSTDMAVPKNIPPVSVFSDMSSSDSVMALDREKYFAHSFWSFWKYERIDKQKRSGSHFVQACAISLVGWAVLTNPANNIISFWLYWWLGEDMASRHLRSSLSLIGAHYRVPKGKWTSERYRDRCLKNVADIDPPSTGGKHVLLKRNKLFLFKSNTYTAGPITFQGHDYSVS